MPNTNVITKSVVEGGLRHPHATLLLYTSYFRCACTTSLPMQGFSVGTVHE